MLSSKQVVKIFARRTLTNSHRTMFTVVNAPIYSQLRLQRERAQQQKVQKIDSYVHCPWTTSELRYIEINNAELAAIGTPEQLRARMQDLLTKAKKQHQSSSHQPNSLQLSVKTLKDIPRESLRGKRVFVRVDFNVKYDIPESPSPSNPIKVKPSSMKRIVESIPTIAYLVESGARVILCSHLGDPTPEQSDVKQFPEFSLAPVASAVESLLRQKASERTTNRDAPSTLASVRVQFVPECTGPLVKSAVKNLPPSNVLLLENTRLVPKKAEKKNDLLFAQALKDTLEPDLYVNDAFGTAHRSHVSVVGLPSILSCPKVAGFLLAKEVQYLQSVLPEKREKRDKSAQTVVILGGAKVTSKVPVLQNLIPRADVFLIGGAMALPFLRAQGISGGHELGTPEEAKEAVSAAQGILEKIKTAGVEVVLPTDFVVSQSFAKDAPTEVRDISSLRTNDYAIDIGPETSRQFDQIISDPTTRVVVWNGPAGVFEWDNAANGTFELVRSISNATEKGLISVVGGGETAQAVSDCQKRRGMKPTFTHVSTGGGASLELLEGKVLPALTVLDA